MPTISGDMQAVLATDKVRFQGQEVAFVVADDRYSARDALELIDVEYEPLPVVVDVQRALDRRRAADPRRPAGPARQPHLRLGGRRPGRHRPRVRRRRRRRRAGDGASRARIRRRWRPAARSPTTTGSPEADDLGHDPGAARPPDAVRAADRSARASDPGRLSRHRRRVRQQGAGLPGLRLRGRRRDHDRAAGQMDGGPLREPDVAGVSRVTT